MVYCTVKVYSVYVMMRQIVLRGTSTVSKVSLFSNPFSDIFISLYVNMQIYMPSTDIFIFIMVLMRVGEHTRTTLMGTSTIIECVIFTYSRVCSEVEHYLDNLKLGMIIFVFTFEIIRIILLKSMTVNIYFSYHLFQMILKTNKFHDEK